MSTPSILISIFCPLKKDFYIYFMDIWGIVETTGPRYFVQPDALFPEAERNALYPQANPQAPRPNNFDYHTSRDFPIQNFHRSEGDIFCYHQ